MLCPYTCVLLIYILATINLYYQVRLVIVIIVGVKVIMAIAI